MKLKELNRLSISEVVDMKNCGEIEEDLWRQYAHDWQLRSGRFEIRICRCHNCLRKYGKFDDQRSN